MTKFTITETARGGVVALPARLHLPAGGVTAHAAHTAQRDAIGRHTDAPSIARHAPRRLPGWLWFVALWCGGVGAAMLTGFAFMLLMNATLFAVMR